MRARLKSGKCPVGTSLGMKVRQTPGTRISVSADRKRKAKRPGDRGSYTERRQNRSDLPGTRL